MSYIDNILFHRTGFLVVVFALALATACGDSSRDNVDAPRAVLETVSDSAGPISQIEGEELTVNSLGTPAPVDAFCAVLETVPDRAGLIDQSEAEELTVDTLGMPFPSVSATEVEGVVASCLTMLRSYEQVLLGEAWTSADPRSPDTPVWIVEVKGISRPDGISEGNAKNPYRYAMHVLNAGTGDMIAGSRYWEPKMAQAQ